MLIIIFVRAMDLLRNNTRKYSFWSRIRRNEITSMCSRCCIESSALSRFLFWDKNFLFFSLGFRKSSIWRLDNSWRQRSYSFRWTKSSSFFGTSVVSWWKCLSTRWSSFCSWCWSWSTHCWKVKFSVQSFNSFKIHLFFLDVFSANYIPKSAY